MPYIANISQRPFNQNDVEKTHAVPTANVTSYFVMVTCFKNFSFKDEFESSNDTLWCYMKDTNLRTCINLTILERCLHYLMITPRIFMVSKVFKPLKFYCIYDFFVLRLLRMCYFCFYLAVHTKAVQRSYSRPHIAVRPSSLCL